MVELPDTLETRSTVSRISPDEIVDSGHDWQKNEGDYFPEWLREIAVELVRPVPPEEDVLQQVKNAEGRKMPGQLSLNWVTTTGTAEVKNIQRSWIALSDSTGLLLYAGGFGWSGEFKDYADFHGRKIARTVSSGSPEVTARMVLLEDLPEESPCFFNAEANGGDSQPLQTVLLDETTLRRNLLPSDPAPWPPPRRTLAR